MEQLIHLPPLVERFVGGNPSASEVCRSTRSALLHGRGPWVPTSAERLRAFADELVGRWSRSPSGAGEALLRVCGSFPDGSDTAWRLVSGRPRPESDAGADALHSDLVCELLERLHAAALLGADVLRRALALSAARGLAGATKALLVWSRFRASPRCSGLDEWGGERMLLVLDDAVDSGSLPTVKALLDDMLVAVLLPPSWGAALAAQAARDAEGGAGVGGGGVGGDAEGGAEGEGEGDADGEGDGGEFSDNFNAVSELVALRCDTAATHAAVKARVLLRLYAPGMQIPAHGVLDESIALSLGGPDQILSASVLNEVYDHFFFGEYAQGQAREFRAAGEGADSDGEDEDTRRWNREFRAGVLVHAATRAIASAAAAGSPAMLAGVVEFLRTDLVSPAFFLSALRAARAAMRAADPRPIRALIASGLVDLDAFTVAVCVADASPACLREVLLDSAPGPVLDRERHAHLLHWFAIKASLSGDAARLGALLDCWEASGTPGAAACVSNIAGLHVAAASGLSEGVRGVLRAWRTRPRDAGEDVRAGEGSKRPRVGCSYSGV